MDTVKRRPRLGRVVVDPQYVRDEFARMVEAQPYSLRWPDPRLYALYPIPQREEC
jgi:hypothetical protein